MAGTTETIPFNGCQYGVSHVSIPVSATLFPFTQSPPREKRVETKADLASGVVLQTVIYKDLYGMLTVFLKREKKCYVFK